MLDNPNIPFTTIPSFIHCKVKKLKTVENQRRAAAPRKISSRSSRNVTRKMKQNPSVTRQQLQED